MDPRFSAARAAIFIAGGVMLLAATSTADAQRRNPRGTATAKPRSSFPITAGVPSPAGPVGLAGTRFQRDRLDHGRFRNQRRDASTVFIPFGGYGFANGLGYAYGDGFRYAYYPTVYDANGRPLVESYDGPAPTGGAGYTPDLSGNPYVVNDEGQMVVDFASGGQRAFRACAETADQRDPQGRPRTIFYRSPDAWMIQRPGQRGRVRGEPPTGTAACYAIDSVGRVVLRY